MNAHLFTQIYDQTRYLALLDLFNTRYTCLISNPEGGEIIDNKSDQLSKIA